MRPTSGTREAANKRPPHLARALMDLRGRTAVVTGGAAGVGRGIARALARAGAALVLNDIDEPALDAAAGELSGAGASVAAVPGDIADSDTIERLMSAAIADPAFRILVNNAGLTDTYKPFHHSTVDDWDRILGVNLRAAFLTSVAAASHWVERGIRGAILNVSSPGAVRSHMHNSIYDASKGGLDALTRSMAVDLGPYGIRVNALAPAAYQDDGKPQPGAPLGCGASAADVGAAAVFLLSDAAKLTTGHVFPVDGGLLAQLRITDPDQGNA